MIRVTIEATTPDDDLEPLLKAIRAFDLTHPGCHFKVLASGDNETTVGEAVQMMERVGIPLVYAGRKSDTR